MAGDLDLREDAVVLHPARTQYHKSLVLSKDSVPRGELSTQGGVSVMEHSISEWVWY